ncbi:hypothetical protein NTE_03387 [Candidatus Nitrososphaera evergladensis SR1]|uniref:Phage integrase family protein n=1 Tax=Candidatus Nitrososphaera evergladensis SR1 TaxID=1459636 RepID=A0A075MVY3_9ARCH|nr:hypothetical protein [Candidatus Nitrososphaera evergladensis]AIF85415.1 hypothetical protein NTE_03387 [Candidatus Nitrososphaera evergladensis SR1]
MAVVAGFQSTIKPSMPAPSLSSGDTSLKGIRKSRMRDDSGKRVADKGEIERRIVQLLEKPKTTGELAALMNRSSPKSFYRDYIKPMFERGLIEKDGDYWKRKGAAEETVRRERFEDLTDEAFGKLPCMQRLVKKMSEIERGDDFYGRIRRICTGQYIKGFKCHPEAWVAADNKDASTNAVTQTFVDAYKAEKGTTRLDSMTRQAVRYFYSYVIGREMTDAEKTEYGLDGKKDRIGMHNDVKLTDEQIDAGLDFFINKEENEEMAAYWAFAIETFGRPNRVFNADPDKFTFAKRKITKAIIEGFDEPIYEPKLVQFFRGLALVLPGKVRIETVESEIMTGELYESKTDRTWKKFALHPKSVAIIKAWVEQRRRAHRNTMFGDDGESYDEFALRINHELRKVYLHLGLIKPVCGCGKAFANNDDYLEHGRHKNRGKTGCPQWKKKAKTSYWEDRPSYTLRHCGAHLWLRRTGYNYGAVAAMGWEDLSTLRTWYGAFDMTQLEANLMREW